LSFVGDADDQIAQRRFRILHVVARGGAVSGENDALVQTRPMRIDGKDGGALVVSPRVERLADDGAAATQARVADC
jgi:hypothetical protein